MRVCTGWRFSGPARQQGGNEGLQWERQGFGGTIGINIDVLMPDSRSAIGQEEGPELPGPYGFVASTLGRRARYETDISLGEPVA